VIAAVPLVQAWSKDSGPCRQLDPDACVPAAVAGVESFAVMPVALAVKDSLRPPNAGQAERLLPIASRRYNRRRRRPVGAEHGVHKQERTHQSRLNPLEH